MNSIETLIAQIKTAKVEMKGIAAAARNVAEKGTKMAAGQHAQAVYSAQLATAALGEVTKAGYSLAGVSGKTSKTGRSEVTFTYRQELTLAARIEQHKNAAARRAEKRAAAKAAAAPVVMPTPASNALSALDAMLNRKAA